MHGGLLEGAAQQAANYTAQQPLATQQVATQLAQQNALLAQQAQGRKKHLTNVYLSKGCQLADIQK